MAAGRVIKGGGGSAVPYTWSAPPRPAPIKPPPAPPETSRPASREELDAAHKIGYLEGEAAVRAEHESRLAQAVAELAASAASLSELRPNVFRSAQADLLRLSLAIARRILHREILMSADVLNGIIAVALEKLEQEEIQRLRVHPSMLERVQQAMSVRHSHRPIQVSADSSLPPGGCVFETSRGNVDTGIESQLAEIESGLADYLETKR